MATVSIKDRYLRLLNDFQDSNIRTEEGRQLQALRILTQYLTSEDSTEPYIHLPANGEYGTPDGINEAFKTMQVNHAFIEDALTAVLAHTNKLESALEDNGEALTALFDQLQAEIMVRALNTEGQEAYEKQIVENFLWPLTLAPESETDLSDVAEEIEWVPNDPNSVVWIGNISNDPENPESYPLSNLFDGQEVTVQSVAWNMDNYNPDILLAALQDALTEVADITSLDPDDFFVVSEQGANALGNPDGSGTLKIRLRIPTRISHIRLTTRPAGAVNHVVIINQQGVPSIYEMIEDHVFIRPTTVQEIQFFIVGGDVNPDETIPAHFLAILDFLDVEGGSLHLTGHFRDRVSANLTGTEISLASNRAESTVAPASKKTIRAAILTRMGDRVEGPNKVIQPPSTGMDNIDHTVPHGTAGDDIQSPESSTHPTPSQTQPQDAPHQDRDTDEAPITPEQATPITDTPHHGNTQQQ